MQPTDLTRADLYARSAAYAESVRDPNRAATFTRRGIALAGDRWPEVYYRATGTTAPEPKAEAAPKTRKAK